MSDLVTDGAGQLHPVPGRLRQIQHPDHVSPSTRSPEDAWPYDIWSDLWNEAVWDGFTLLGSEDDPDAEKHSLVGWTLTGIAEGRARDAVLKRIEGKLDQLLARGA